MIPTPDLSHLTKADYELVYEPSEDTFLLLDALEKDAEALRALRPAVCLEIGSGSGCVSSFLGDIVGHSAALYICTDINPHASRCTLLTGRQNKVPLEPLTASLTSPLCFRLKHAVDIMIFNPPYVPTVPDEAEEAQIMGNISGAWAGGQDGMYLTNQLLCKIRELLSPSGWFYLVAVKENNIPHICQRMLEEQGLQSEIVLQRRAGSEHLFVIRFSRN